MTDLYGFIIFIVVAASLIMLVAVHGNVVLPLRTRKNFHTAFCLIAVAALCEFAGYRFAGTGGAAKYFIPIIKLLEYSIAPTIVVLFAAILCPHRVRRLQIADVLLAMHAAFQVISIPFGLVCKVDETGAYTHGTCYFVYIAAYVLAAVFVLCETLRFSKNKQNRNRLFPVLVLGFGLCGAFIQLIDSDARISWLALLACSVFYYIFYCTAMQQTDALTSLLNRYSYENAVSLLDEKAILIVFDIDNFKDVNDNYGHAVGDECLKLVGHCIYEVYGQHAGCYRYGGDEFCAILTNLLEHVEVFNERFEHVIQEQAKNHEWMPGVSVGYALYDPKTDVKDDVFNLADDLMYEKKKARELAQ